VGGTSDFQFTNYALKPCLDRKKKKSKKNPKKNKTKIKTKKKTGEQLCAKNFAKLHKDQVDRRPNNDMGGVPRLRIKDDLLSSI